MIKLCENCNCEMELKVVQNKSSKNYGKLISNHKNKRFCSTKCQIEWQKNCKWEDRVGEETAKRIRSEARDRISGDKNPTCNPIVAKKVSDSLKKYLKENPRYGDKNPFYGKKHTDEFIKLAKDSRKGKWSYNEEQKKKQENNTPKGNLHPNWMGGISNIPYSFDFNKNLKTYIKKRDNYSCNICGKQTQKLAIHHIDYIKENSNEINLISLCYSCHGKTNVNREHWKKFFNGIIEEKYDKLTDIENGMIFE